MRPIRLKQLLSENGEVTRIFLTPEDASQARKRKKFGGNRGKKVCICAGDPMLYWVVCQHTGC